MAVRKILKNFVIGALLAAIPALASATPCGFGTLASYMAPGFSCTLASETLSGFSLTSSATGGAAALNGNDIYANPIDFGPGDGYIIQWESPSNAGLGSTVWQATAGQQLNFAISYNAAADPGFFAYYYSDDFASQVTGNGTWTEIDSASSPSVGRTNSETAGKCGPLIADCPFAGAGELGIAIQPVEPYTLDEFTFNAAFALDGGQSGSATVSLDNTYVNEIGVPEPSSLLLFGAGLLALGLVNCTRLKHRTFNVAI